MVNDLKRPQPWSDTPFPLGRGINHDPASLNFPAEIATTLKTTYHPRQIGILDQGQLGSCTGNAITGLLGTEPFFTKLSADQQVSLNEDLAVKLYSAATGFDPWPGTYPPDDTGSSGLAVAKAAKRAGYLKSYRHAFGLEMALLALVRRPVIIGINWYEGMFHPKQGGLIEISGSVAGGHEIVLDSVDVENKLVGGANSWGAGWGDSGRFKMTWDTFGQLLKQDGDVMTAGALA
jgi:hypothetical protein